MDQQAFFSQLADVLQVNPAEVNEAFRLTPENWDSMAILATIALIDTHFGMTVPTNELTACKSVGAVLELVRRTRG